MSNPSPRLGLLLKRAREQKGMTLAELANKIEYSLQHICDVECGRRPFPASKMIPWARTLGIMPDLIYINMLTLEGDRLQRLSGIKLDYDVIPKNKRSSEIRARQENQR